MDTMKLSLDRENTIHFDVQIEGYSNSPSTSKPQVRMLLGNTRLSVCLPAVKENDGYSVTIPEMKNVLEVGDYEAKMEVIIDNKFFVPWESVVAFDKEVKVEAAPVVRQPKPSVTVTASTVKKKTPIVKEDKPSKGLVFINDLPKKKKRINKKRS